MRQAIIIVILVVVAMESAGLVVLVLIVHKGVAAIAHLLYIIIKN